MTLLGKVGRAAAVALVAGTVGGAAVLTAEAVIASRRRYAQPALGLNLRTSIGEPTAPPLRLVMLGDSSALGVGVDRVADTVGGQLATLLAADRSGTGRRIELASVGVSGSRSKDLATQVSRSLLGERPDVAVILVGANDVIGMRRPGEAAAYLASAVRRLREAGVEVVVGTCPDLGAARAIAPPLRQIVGWMGRKTARAQMRSVHAAGGAVVDLGAETGAVFRADPATLCHDRYHPSADGYRVWAYALLPAVAQAAGVSPRLP
ncbi:lysophospholipase L1-like esterase [Allocatelliglobosispora scoriae]|uniref:Lysophospholipase L1-like esterase n=1 Tax=Allocatelliglobosispora scoriae TaxID=643052 RepID=A0A841BSJ3_9ACTN|nr:SGNH/GDSL hydrolase family protein [Allocatelliglobosispora scoriae]MBB5870366.1 lysophospholipase L1-like esterase [Allocatelliglobosispora scoriae]